MTHKEFLKKADLPAWASHKRNLSNRLSRKELDCYARRGAADCGEYRRLSSIRSAALVPRRLPGPMMAMARRHKAAEYDPANHCHKNEPKLRVNSSIDSHVVLHGRPWV
jgi:hypothetical protein